MRTMLIAGLAVLTLSVSIPAGAVGDQTYRYWNRPYMELVLIQKSRGVVAGGTVADARCRGKGKPRVTRAGVRTFNQFYCDVRSSAGRVVGLTIRPTGARSFRVVGLSG